MTQQDLLLISNELEKVGTVKWKQILNGGAKLVVNENERLLQFSKNEYLLKLEQKDGLQVQTELYKFQCSFKSSNGINIRFFFLCSRNPRNKIDRSKIVSSLEEYCDVAANVTFNVQHGPLVGRIRGDFDGESTIDLSSYKSTDILTIGGGDDWFDTDESASSLSGNWSCSEVVGQTITLFDCSSLGTVSGLTIEIVIGNLKPGTTYKYVHISTLSDCFLLRFFRFGLTVSKDSRIASDKISLTTLPISSQSGLKLSLEKISSDTDPIIRLLGHISDSKNSLTNSTFYHEWKFYENQKNTLKNGTNSKWILTNFPNRHW